jgi:1-hydroxycarotenoid 3,4-desaturase
MAAGVAPLRVRAADGEGGMTPDRVVVIGAGVGGLTAAIDLARRGADVTVVDRAAGPGGKMRRVQAGGAGIDAGPTVFTMRWIFQSLFADAGARLEDCLDLHAADLLARHAWRAGGRLDLFADIDRSADAIGVFAGAKDARGYRAYCARSASMYRTLVSTFIGAEKPSVLDLTRRVGFSRLDKLLEIAPTKTLWPALAEHFSDPRLRQLFGRYATYVGSSPLLAPATMMLVAHVEQDGVWLVTGGMVKVAEALHKLGVAKGARYEFGTQVTEIKTARGRVSGVVLSDGQRLEADAIVYNGDVSALETGLLGGAAARAVPAVAREDRSLSAITWCINAETSGFPLAHHNVFFAEDYPAEFDAVFRKRDIVDAPTVYVCAQDRGGPVSPAPGAPERLLVLINAPPDGDSRKFDAGDFADRTFSLLARCGLTIKHASQNSVPATPTDYNTLFPATGGALYGRANHGPFASFTRPSAVSSLTGLYLAGGSVHPGPGVPMAAMSGRLAAARLLDDLAISRGGKRQTIMFTP